MYLVSTLVISLLESLIDLNIHVHSLASYRIYLPSHTHTSIRSQAFSDDVEEFRTFHYSLYYLTGSLTGDFSFAAGVFRSNRYLGAIYMVTYTCFISFVGASMFIAIIDMSFATVHGEAWDESGEQTDPLIEEMRRQYHKIRRSIGWVLHQFHLKRSLERARVKARLAMHLDKKEDVLHRRKARHDQSVIGMVGAGGDREGGASIDRTIQAKGEMGEGAAAEGKNTASDDASMWTMAAERFATLPFSNGHDKRYEAIKTEIRALYGATAINKDNQTRLKILAVSKGADAPDSAAEPRGRCATKFNFFKRRHHCRLCGLVFCDRCAQFKRVLPGKDPYNPSCNKKAVRVCGVCSRMPDELPIPQDMFALRMVRRGKRGEKRGARFCRCVRVRCV